MDYNVKEILFTTIYKTNLLGIGISLYTTDISKPILQFLVIDLGTGET